MYQGSCFDNTASTLYLASVCNAEVSGITSCVQLQSLQASLSSYNAQNSIMRLLLDTRFVCSSFGSYAPIWNKTKIQNFQVRCVQFNSGSLFFHIDCVNTLLNEFRAENFHFNHYFKFWYGCKVSRYIRPGCI